jgi:hypothetical protein
MNKHLWSIALASTSLLACNNPAPFEEAAEAAGASAALDKQLRACELAEPVTSVVPEQTRGLYAAVDDAGATDSCTAGSYALRVELDVYTRPETAVFSAEHDPGRGTATLLLRADIDEARDATLQLCGLDLPASYAYASSKVTQLMLSNDMWDRPSMPRWNSHLTQGQLSFPLLLGIALTQPAATWPTYEQTPALDCGAGQYGEACFPDHDGDGQPGVSLTARSGEVSEAPYPACGEWHHAPASADPDAWLGLDSNDPARTFVGLRTALQLSLACDEGTGSARAADIATRVLDCENCSARQASVIDARSPIFHVLARGETPPASFGDSRAFIDEALDRSPSRGGQLEVKRLPSDAPAAGCVAVRTR